MKLHELSSQQITALKLVMVRMGIWEGDLDGNFSISFGHAFNRMQNRLGLNVNSTYDPATDAALKAFFQFTTGGDWTWDLDAGGVVDSDGMLVEEWKTAATTDTVGGTEPPDPTPPDVTEEELDEVEEAGMTEAEERDYRARAIGYLEQYGLATPELIGYIDTAIEEGWSATTFENEIKNSESFKARFPYYETLAERGTPLTVPQLVDYERGVIEALQRYGLSDIYSIPAAPLGSGGQTPVPTQPGDPGTGPRPGRGDIRVDDRYIGTNPYPDGYTTGNPTPGGIRPGQRSIEDPFSGPYAAGGTFSETRRRPGDRSTDKPPAATYVGSGGSGSGGGGGGSGGSSARPDPGPDISGLPPIVGSEVQDLIRDLIESDVSVRELEERLGRGYAQVYNQDPAIQEFFAAAYGPAGEAALAAYFLDPDMDAEVLFDRAETAVLGGTSTMVFSDETISLTRAERMQSLGISQGRAWQAFTQLNELGALFEETIGEQIDMSRSEEGVDALLGLTPMGMRTLEQRRRSRVAGFSGGGGFAASQEGITGFGSSSS